jgi:hypothetical protein
VLGLRHTCSTSRVQTLGTNGRKTMAAYLSSVPCLFLPMSNFSQIQNNFDIGTGWNVYFNDGTDVQVGDKLTFGGSSYLVRGSKAYTGLPMVSHLEIAAVSENAHA